MLRHLLCSLSIVYPCSLRLPSQASPPAPDQHCPCYDGQRLCAGPDQWPVLMSLWVTVGPPSPQGLCGVAPPPICLALPSAVCSLYPLLLLSCRPSWVGPPGPVIRHSQVCLCLQPGHVRAVLVPGILHLNTSPGVPRSLFCISKWRSAPSLKCAFCM